MLTLYGLKQCSTCVKAQKWLDDHNLDHTFIDYREQPVAASELKRWSDLVGGWTKLVNRASLTWRNLDEADRHPESDEQWQSLIARYPALVRRPVAVAADTDVGVGFSEKRYLERFVKG